MLYRDFGKTGVKISALGFGAMRLPMMETDGKSIVDEDKAVPLIRKAYELGVNYFDTAYIYRKGYSEPALGKAVKGIRDKIYIATKFPYWGKTDKRELRRILEDQLKKLDTDYVDFYYMHGMNGRDFKDVIIGCGFLEEALRAKDEGLIKHLSFSFHDRPEVMRQIADSGYFETVLCQYNFLARINEESIAYVRQKGLGVVAMGPVAGGRITEMQHEISGKFGMSISNAAELAFRFVLANPYVDCALSGMSDIAMLEENAETASHSDEPLTDKEKESLSELMSASKRIAESYCTLCGNCMPCPQGVNIPYIFNQMINYKVFGMENYGRDEYAKIGSEMKGEKADKCVECGICEERCPYGIKIIRQLKECIGLLGLEI